MGYEIKLIIGKKRQSNKERVEDKSKPFSDSSGFETLKNEKGEDVFSGRQETYFSVMAEIDLCKLGYQQDALNELIESTQKAAIETSKTEVVYFYGTDGNTEIKEDKYGAPFGVVSVRDALAVIKDAHPIGNYRRADWAIALLSAMENDPEELQVLFFGH